MTTTMTNAEREAFSRPPTANWQSPAPAEPVEASPVEALRLTVRDCARIMNVSERSVYRARELIRTGRADLEAEVMAGKLSLLGALKAAKPEKYGHERNMRPGDDRYDALVRTWNACDDDGRARFIVKLRAMLEEALRPSSRPLPAP